MDHAPLPMTLQPASTYQVATFTRDIHNQETLDAVHEQLRQWVDATSGPRLVMDFGALRYVGSSFLGMMMAVAMQITRKEGQMRICRMSPEIRDLFALTKMERIVPVADTLEDAVASLS